MYEQCYENTSIKTLGTTLYTPLHTHVNRIADAPPCNRAYTAHGKKAVFLQKIQFSNKNPRLLSSASVIDSVKPNRGFVTGCRIRESLYEN